MTTKREEFLKQLLETFRLEGEEHVQRLTAGLLALERESDPARRAEETEIIYREAHSLKGAARAVGLHDVEIICQATESVLSGCKRGELALSQALLDMLHGANDLTGRLIANQGDLAPSDLNQIDHCIRRLEKAAAGLEFQEPPPACPGEGEGSATAGAEAVPPEIPVQSSPAEMAKQEEPCNNTGVTVIPESSPVPGADVESSRLPELAPIHPEPAAPPAPSAPSVAARAQTIRVSTTQIDAILHQSEELVGVRQKLEHRAKKLAELYGAIHEWRSHWKKQGPACRELKKRLAGEPLQATQSSKVRQMTDLMALIEEQQQRLNWLEGQARELKFQADQDRRSLELLLEALRNGVRRALMLPFSHLLAGFPKIVRDLARDLGKQVEFTMLGDEAQVDRRILEELKDPLLHLVRNALDHGLESPEDRRKAGKPETGALRLAVSQIGSGKLELTLTDDGRGLDPDRLRKEAVRRKLLTADQAGKMNDEQAVWLIFHSGFSTTQQVSELSGRGLGMAIVSEKIEALGGELRIDNRPGQGVAFRMTLPASMSTTRGILVQAGGRIFCLPIGGVEHVLRFRTESLSRTQGVPTINWQGQCVSFVPLARLVGIAEPPDDAGDRRHLVALLIGNGAERLALGVQRILSEQEVVVRGLGPRIRRLKNVAGTTVLGTGELVPILHLSDLIQSAHHIYSQGSGLASDVEEAFVGRRILVADDSITTRMLLKNIIESAGHTVVTAADGEQALEMLRQGDYDLLVSDVEMPHMGGFELCQTLRKESRWSALPVILCTSLGSEADRRRGLECGANAYIVKRDLEHGQLLELVAQLA